MPRLVLFLVWLFKPAWLGSVFETTFWPFLGFLFMPLTTLAYAFAWHQGDGVLTPIGWAMIVVAVLVDLGLIGTGARSRKRPREIVVKGERVG